MKTKVLYIEDEQFLGKIVKETLEKQGYEVHWVTDGVNVMNAFNSFSPDLCIVDIMLPNIDGYTLSKNIRGMHPDLPIIFLTAKTETADLIMGFKSGGTDYLRKPFSIEELIARIENQINIHNGKEQLSEMPEEIIIGKFTYNSRLHELTGPAGTTRLSYRDSQVLNILYANRNHITDRKNLLLSVWGDDSFFNSRNLDVYIRKLRQYFKEDQAVKINTLKGKGYLFIVP